MRKLFTHLRRTPKRVLVAALMAVAVIAVPAIGHAWGPSRPTYTIQQPADHVTFDSITNNPDIGDERNFVSIRPSDSTGTWNDTQTVEPGQTYTVRMYVHNNAASNLNLVAHDVTAMFNLPTNTAKSIDVDGYISSSNATPQEVWDQATFTSSQDFNLAYVPGTLEYYNNANPNGVAIPESVFTSAGAKLGYQTMDGNIPGCFQYAGYLTFTVKPQFAQNLNFTLQKKVSAHGANNWQDNYTAKPGETVDYLLLYQNTGDAQNDNVTFRDSLPKGMTYVAGSGSWSNAETQNVKFDDDSALTNGTGVNIGSYATGANAYIIYSAKVPDASQLTCGANSLVNNAKVTTMGYSVSASATVTVNNDCTPPPVTTPPVYTCDQLTASALSRSEFQFTAKATASNGATIKDYSFNFGDGQTVTQAANVATHTYAQAGTYPVSVTVNFTVNGQTESESSANCATKVTVAPLPPTQIQVCDLATKQVVTIDASAFDSSKYSKDLNTCCTPTPPKPQPIKVCDLETKQIVTIDQSDYDSNKYSKNLDDCQTPPLALCTVPGKTTLPASSSDCKPTPNNTPTLTPPTTTTPALPETGISGSVLSVLGLGSVAASTLYYLASRRN